MRTLAWTIGLMMAAALVVGPPAALGTDWQAGVGNWDNDGCWTLGEPGQFDTAYIDNGGTAQVTYAGEVCAGLSLATQAGQSGHLQISSGALTVGGTENIGARGMSICVQTGGQHVVQAELSLGYFSTGWASYRLDNGDLYATHTEYIGYEGTGLFIQNGGGHYVTSGFCPTVSLGGNGGYGQYVQTDGVFNTSVLEIANGEFDQTGGQNNADVVNMTSGGIYELTGGVLNPAAIGNYTSWDRGELIIDGGTLLTDEPATTIAVASLWVGKYVGNVGYYGFESNVSITADYVYLGGSGKGTLTQDGGTNTAGSLLLGVWDWKGVYNLNAGQLTAGQESVGDASYGEFYQTGGTNTVSTSFYVGHLPYSDGIYELSGAGSLSAPVEYVGDQGTGTFTQTGGTNTVSGQLCLGHTTSGDGTYNLGGGNLYATDLTVGDEGIGAFNQSGGLCSLTGDLLVGDGYNGAGTCTMEGGDLRARFEYVGVFGDGTFNHSGGSNEADGLVVGYVSSGYYNLDGPGTLTMPEEYLGALGGWGYLTQTAGDNDAGTLYIGFTADAGGLYELHGTGTLAATEAYVGFTGSGTVWQTNGVAGINDLYVAYGSDSSGTYQLGGGGLTSNSQYIGWDGVGDFVHTDGSNTVHTQLVIGANATSRGTYYISGGSLEVAEVHVFNDALLDIADANASINVHSFLRFGPTSHLSAVPRSRITMRQAHFYNESTSSSNLAGLANLRLAFQDNYAGFSTVEVAGKDLGPVASAWNNNFALGALEIGGPSPGKIRLVNSQVNQPGWGGAEALYVYVLAVDYAAAIDLNNLNLYFMYGGQPKQLFYGDATVDGSVDGADYTVWADHYEGPGGWAEGDFNGDGWVDGADYTLWADNYEAGGGSSIPEPATPALLILGGLPLIRRRRR